MFDETPEATGIIDFDSLIPVCQIVVQKFSWCFVKNPYACNFAIIRLCGKQSNTLYRSVSSATYLPPWSSDF